MTQHPAEPEGDEMLKWFVVVMAVGFAIALLLAFIVSALGATP